jgi:hypothetical protein
MGTLATLTIEDRDSLIAEIRSLQYVQLQLRIQMANFKYGEEDAFFATLAEANENEERILFLAEMYSRG